MPSSRTGNYKRGLIRLPLLWERYQHWKSRHGSRWKSTRSEVISTFEGNILLIDNRHFAGNDALTCSERAKGRGWMAEYADTALPRAAGTRKS